MQSEVLKQGEAVGGQTTHTAESSCLENSFQTKYREIMSQKLALQFGKHEEAAPRGEAESPKYEQWLNNYRAELALGSKEPLHASLKLSFKEQLKSTHLAYYLQIMLHISIAVLSYYVFINIAQGAYQSLSNLYLILPIIIIAVLRPFLTQFADRRLHAIGFQMYRLMSEALVRKSLKCSVLSNKGISISEMSEIMHIECEKLLTYPSKSVAVVEGALYIVFLSGFIVYLGGLGGLIGIICFILMISIRFCLRSTFTRTEQEFKNQTSIRVKAEIEVFSMIKFIKVNSLESCYFNKLRKIRMNQIQKLKAKLLVASFAAGLSIATKQAALVVIMKLILMLNGNFGLPIAFAINLAFTFTNLHSIVKNINDYSDVKVALKKIEKFLNTEEMDTSYLTYGSGLGQVLISIKNGSFYWDREEDKSSEENKASVSTFKLKNINVQINRGELLALIGPYASGKSSFANSLLGEMKSHPTSQIHINGSVAYCCQIPWIMNDTVKNNILFGKPYNESRYLDAIKYSSLGDDLLILSDRDNTLIGEKGSTLSGGQKARISLARALYSDADIFILDDILSAVDAHVGSFLFNQTIKTYLKHKTVLLITHSLYYVKHTDRILLFDDGQIVQQGTYQQLRNAPILNKVEVADLKKMEENPAFVRANSFLRNTSEGLSLVDRSKDNLVEDSKEELEFGTIIQIFIKRNSGCSFIFLTVLFTLVLGLVLTFFRIQLNVWATSPSKNQSYFFYLLVGINLLMFLLIFLNSMTLYISPMFQSLHDDIIRSLLFAPLSYFQSVPMDKIISRISNELNSNDKIFTMQFMEAEVYCQLMLSYFFGMPFVYLYSKQYLILVYIFVHFGIMGYFYLKFLYQDIVVNQLQQSLIVPIKSKYSEVLNGLSSVRAYNKIKFLFQDITRKTEVYGKASDMRAQIERKIKLVVSISTNFFNIATLIFMFLTGNIVGNLFIFLLFNMFGFQDALIRFHKCLYEVVARFKSLGRCEQLARIQSERGYRSYLANNYVENEEFKHEYFAKEVFPKGKIVFQNYSFRYKPQLNDVLKNLSFTIEAGEKIGIVGRTGSGKSSMMLGLLRIIEASSGKIVIDGIDTSTLSLELLRSNVNIILQDHFLFTGTVRDNVDPTHAHTDQQVIEALKLCGVWQEFEKKEGIYSPIQEGGNNLSAGEKQLINISRSLLNPKRIVLIDQATASIDLQTDAKIQKVIRKHFADKTVMTIAHRINTVIDSDRILVLREGRVAEFGSPSVLLSNPNSLFAQLYKEAGKKKTD